VLTVITCPQCRAPAEITEYFSLPSTDGPVVDMALSCAAGHHFRMPADRLPAHPPGPATGPGTGPAAGQPGRDPASGRRRLRTMTAFVSGLRPHTAKLCIHCQRSAAGFWVSHHTSEVTRRPWCLACSQQLDPARYAVIPFRG